MSGCGDIDYVDGGTINNATVTNSTVQGSEINGSVVRASQLMEITSVDAKAAQTIADAVGALDAEKLQTLAKAILAAMPTPAATTGPKAEKMDYLPTDVIGSRRALLGAPNGWIEWRGVIIPAFKAGE